MRIERLDLIAFGIFTQRSLDLAPSGMHVIVGPNEAGKTTAMRAIRQLLFGIPTRTTDAFLHDMPKLRLGARLSSGAGTADHRGFAGDGIPGDPAALEIVRLKKRKDPLADLRGDPIDPEMLAALLHHTTEEVFTSLFTIGHDEIAAGGEALLASEGELGKAIFSASRGTTDLTAVLRKLRARADQLFTARGHKPRLNAAIERYRSESATAADHTRRASTVVHLDEEISTGTRERERISSELEDLRARSTLLEQVRSTRPYLATRHDRLASQRDLESRGALVDPSLDERLSDAREARRRAQADLRTIEAAIARQAGILGGIVVDSALLEQREAVASLTERLGAHVQDTNDLPDLRARAGDLREKLEELAAGLPAGDLLDDSARPVVTVDERATINELARSHPALDAALTGARSRRDDERRRLDQLTEAAGSLEEPADVTTLVEVSSRIRDEGQLETTFSERSKELAGLVDDLGSRLVPLGLGGSGVPDATAVLTLAVPAIAVIRRTGDRMRAVTQDLAGVGAEIDKLQQQRTEASEELEELIAGRRPPTTEDLAAARSHRERGWQLVRDAWLHHGGPDADRAPDWSGGEPLESSYERAVARADEVADRLREEAETVSQRTNLEGRVRDLETQMANATRERRDLEAHKRELESRWSEHWEPLGLTPGDPGEMESWHDRFSACADIARQMVSVRSDLDDLTRKIGHHSNDLRAGIEMTGMELPGELSLAGLLDHAKQLIERSRSTTEERREHTTAVREAEAALEGAEAKLDEQLAKMQRWTQAWGPAVAVIGLGGDATPTAGEAVLECLDELAALSAELTSVAAEIGTIETRMASFTGALDTLLGALPTHRDLTGQDPATAVRSLGRRLDEAQREATRRDGIAGQLGELDEASAEASGRLEDADGEIAEMVELSGLGDESELAEAIRRSVEHRELTEELAGIEQQLRDSTGKPVDQVIEDASAVGAIDIDAELAQLKGRIEERQAELLDHNERLGRLKDQRSNVDSSGRAAEHSLAAQQALAEVADAADEYVRLVLAHQLLEEQVAALRDQHQGPLLHRARELFAELTLGRYSGIDTDTDERGEPFILARDAQDALRRVEELSTGTRDQLYLAMRLAALEQYIARNGPLPLVLDDLFVHFDDERTEAGLRVLDSLADTTQVLLFTHHGHVADQAARAVPESRLTLHRM